MHRSNTAGNNFETINSDETARSDAREFQEETSKLDVKQPEQDSCWQGDIPQLSNDGLEQSGLEWSGAEGSEQECISIESAVRERKKSGHAHDISRDCKGRECKSKLEGKFIDKTLQEFRTMQEVFSGYEEENGDERLGEIESFNYVFCYRR